MNYNSQDSNRDLKDNYMVKNKFLYFYPTYLVTNSGKEGLRVKGGTLTS